jgi:primase-polymerase (primpol)-like protein
MRLAAPGVNAGGVVVDAVPAALRELPQWVGWRPQARPGKPKSAKIPVNPHTGRPADPTDPKTWGTFDRVLSLVAEQAVFGIGFVFVAGGDFAGVDLDQCRNPKTDRLDMWAEEIVAQVNSYTEVSPSGSGIKAFVRGRLPGRRSRRGKVELYDVNRYFTVTGWRLDGAPADVRPAQPALDSLYHELFNREPVAATPATAPPVVALPDDEALVRRAMRARNGAKFRRLWCGDTTGYATMSEATAALVALLAFWTGPDAGRVERLMRQSGLGRAKFDERRRETTWINYVITTTLPTVTRFYTPNEALITTGGVCSGKRRRGRHDAGERQRRLLAHVAGLQRRFGGRAVHLSNEDAAAVVGAAPATAGRDLQKLLSDGRLILAYEGGYKKGAHEYAVADPPASRARAAA